MGEVVGKDKQEKDYRRYEVDTPVAKFYQLNHLNQTYEYGQKIRSQCFPLGKWKFSIFEAIKLLDEIVDDSDPDNKRPQIYHAIQTGEACRKNLPEHDWFHLLGFLHDLGKVLAHPKMHNLAQWSVVGDTFPVGCAFDQKCVFPQFFIENPDYNNEQYNSKLGIYQEGCGFDNMTFSWGHDEYLYQVLKHNNCTLPEEALYCIRYHSFYPWHKSGAYDIFASQKDRELKKYLNLFQKCDLYSKIDEDIVAEDLIPYYEGLINKYFSITELEW